MQREALALLCTEPELRARRAYRGEIAEDQVKDALRALPGFKVRERRSAESMEGLDYLMARSPGNVRTRVLHQAARELARTFHGARHGHQIATRIVAPGDERAESTTTSMDPKAAGLPNAYAKKGFAVVFSRHTFCVSTALFSIPPPRAPRRPGARLPLADGAREAGQGHVPRDRAQGRQALGGSVKVSLEHFTVEADGPHIRIRHGVGATLYLDPEELPVLMAVLAAFKRMHDAHVVAQAAKEGK